MSIKSDYCHKCGKMVISDFNGSCINCGAGTNYGSFVDNLIAIFTVILLIILLTFAIFSWG